MKESKTHYLHVLTQTARTGHMSTASRMASSSSPHCAWTLARPYSSSCSRRPDAFEAPIAHRSLQGDAATHSQAHDEECRWRAVGAVPASNTPASAPHLSTGLMQDSATLQAALCARALVDKHGALLSLRAQPSAHWAAVKVTNVSAEALHLRHTEQGPRHSNQHTPVGPAQECLAFASETVRTSWA